MYLEQVKTHSILFYVFYICITNKIYIINIIINIKLLVLPDFSLQLLNCSNPYMDCMYQYIVF